MKKWAAWILVGWTCSVALGTDKYQITWQLSPTHESLNFRENEQIFGSKLSFNTGIEYKYFFTPKTSFSLGLLYQDKGYRNVLDIQTDNNESAVLVGSVGYLSVPFSLNAHISIAKKTELLLSTGFTTGVLIRQRIKGKRIPDGEQVDFAYFPENNETSYNPGFFKPYFLGWDVGLGIAQYIKSKFIMVLQPKYTRGLVEAFRRDAALVGDEFPKFDSFAIDIRAGYYFNRQIEQKKKDF